MAHNYYQQPGGEDRSFAAEADTLENNGHYVHRFTVHNDIIPEMHKLKVARATFWNPDTYNTLDTLFEKERFDIAHFQNIFPLISPSAYAVAQKHNIPVVQSLRNYRLMCPTATFFRDGKVCEDCLGKTIPYPGVMHACYRDSRVQSAVVAGMLGFHHIRKTWSSNVDRFIALTQFVKDKFIEAGMSGDKITVKPNFVGHDPGVGTEPGDYMIFMGRLTPEKGVRTLLNACKQHPDIPLKLLGDGPLLDELKATAKTNNLAVEFLGHRNYQDVMALVQQSRALIFPTEWYETFGRVSIEAYACGKPVIASKIGAVAEIVDHGKTGLQFAPGNADELAQHIKRLWENPEEAVQMGRFARQVFEEKYTSAQNYEMLFQIYSDVINTYSPQSLS